MLEKSISHHRRSQHNLGITRKSVEKENFKEDYEEKLPSLSKFQTLEINLSEFTNEEKKMKEPTKIKPKINLKRIEAKEAKKRVENEEGDSLPKDNSQKLFFIRNLGLG